LFYGSVGKSGNPSRVVERRLTQLPKRVILPAGDHARLQGGWDSPWSLARLGDVAIEPGLRWLPSQIVATFRFALAVVYLVAIWADPVQPVRQASVGFALLLAYGAWSALLLLLAYRDWWADFRLARIALGIDCLAAIGSVYFTEGAQQDFATPLAAFFVFILVSATLLAGWRMALLAGVTVPVGILAVVWILSAQGIAVEPIRAGRRFGYLLIIAAIFVWYGGRRGLPPAPRFLTVPQPGSELPLEDALRYAMTVFAAGCGRIVWRPRSGPRIVIETPLGEGLPCDSPPPADWPADLSTLDAPILFGLRDQAITLDHSRLAAVRSLDFSVDRSAWPGALGALSIPFSASDGVGLILLTRMPTAGRDVLPLAASAAGEIGQTFDRHAASLASYEQGLGRLRHTVARDLHDSVAQSLAGASYRVDAARKAIATGNDPAIELAAVGDALRAEQRQVRSIIARLREGRDMRVRHDLAEDLGALLVEMSEQWRVGTSLARPSERIEVGTRQLHDLRQIVREAVANAARHGRASEVKFALEAQAHDFHLDIVDNGRFTSTAAQTFEPRSIGERVAALGGKLDARRGPAGARLYITVPRLSA
jgi:signal transduction histidine kinase